MITLDLVRRHSIEMHSRKTTAIPDFFFDPQSKVTLKSNKISNIYLLRVGISPSVRQNSEVEFKMMESEIERQNLRNSYPLQTTEDIRNMKLLTK